MPAEFFMNLQKLYDLRKAKKADPGVRTRAAWLSAFPVREMIKRGWIEDAEPALLDLQMMRFFGKSRVEDIPFANDVPVVPYAAKKTGYEDLSAVQYVWLHRVKSFAEQSRPPSTRKKPSGTCCPRSARTCSTATTSGASRPSCTIAASGSSSSKVCRDRRSTASAFGLALNR